MLEQPRNPAASRGQPQDITADCDSCKASKDKIWSITVWNAAAYTAEHKARLQRITRSTEKVIDCNLAPQASDNRDKLSSHVCLFRPGTQSLHCIEVLTCET
ncbi:unnamed protein product [Pleuronectes platessa]|uniref:Uncharacterized protein n=1 Tax=Pleuronectes platessa TaxID=8262 RepID=A0A9N7VK45_PLEPL|nr:unnamed protein product [Pleuronectes platessa]